ncbi:threonine--tRNA ligase [Niallia taxi]|uniref:threonine--tRNA ligase n=1 Tax=Niallia taxi TaxID=2499688 RepID=UPI00254ABF08|nr:threonine--tRNA ligase [Niallia taxi]MDK8638952.1 threonine--tRNA ligase [Niallia taxi]
MNQEKSINVALPDGKSKEYQKGCTAKFIAGDISASLRKKGVAAIINGKLSDLETCLEEDAQLSVVTIDSQVGLTVLRHTAAHVMAQALKRLYPNVQLAIGPVIENGFYYDVKSEKSISISDLPMIEKEMANIIKEDLPINRIEVSFEEGERIWKEREEPYKLELLQAIKDEKISIYEQGEFIDLCRGPHLPRTGMLKAFALTNVSGAYWKGDSENESLQRIYGTAFPTKQALEDYLHFLEEAAKRDHRKLGKQLGLFMFSEEAPGMPFYLPKGQIIRNELEKFSRELQERSGYEEVRTPFMMNQRLWEQSGHWDHYKDNMYFSHVDEQSFALKPMNCPGHMLIFKNNLYSYRDLPIRFAEFGQVHRHEYSGALNGMLRVRTFCQDDAHLFVREDQIQEEIVNVFAQIDQVYSTFGFDYKVELSTRPEDSLGDDSLWEASELALQQVLDSMNINYSVNAGDGAFYGPKIDFHIKDALNRSHQCATIQLDFQMPEKFDLSYINEQNEKVRPVVIHRAVMGSLDRFFAILIEHFGGAFPVWLAPVQVEIIPVSHVHLDYCLEVQSALKEAGIRVEVDKRQEKLGYKIREAQLEKIPYIIVLGDQELKEATVNVRRFGENESEELSVKEFLKFIGNKVNNRSLA